MREEIAHLFNNMDLSEVIPDKNGFDNKIFLRYGAINEFLRGKKKSFLENQKTYDSEQRVRFLSSFDKGFIKLSYNRDWDSFNIQLDQRYYPCDIELSKKNISQSLYRIFKTCDVMKPLFIKYNETIIECVGIKEYDIPRFKIHINEFGKNSIEFL